MNFLPDDLVRFRQYIKERWGISIPASKDYLVESKLRKALETTGLDTVQEILDNQDEVTVQQVAQAVTTNHTFFFREAEHFDALVADVLAKKNPDPLIWCAAASSGEECYSLAIRLFEAGQKDFLILASDIDREMLATINEGIYPDVRLKQVSTEQRLKYFEDKGIKKGTRWFQIKDTLRERIVIKALNLLESHTFPEPFDYILCRNVLIYFDHPTQGRVVDDLDSCLKPGGLLFLGHSESIMTIPHHGSFTQVEASVYRKRS